MSTCAFVVTFIRRWPSVTVNVTRFVRRCFMAESLPNRRSAIHDKSFAPRMAKAAIDNKTPVPSGETEIESESVSLVLDVLADLRVDPKTACDWMRMDRAKFTRLKTGDARLTFDEAWRLPDHVWVVLRARIDEAKGLTSESVDEIEIARALELIGILLRRSFRARTRAVSA